jgi:hypothetical protein
MNKKLLHTLEEAREAEMQLLFQQAYMPEQHTSFEAALRSARQRQRGQRRVMMVMASLVILSMLYALWPGSSANTIERVWLTPVKTQEIAGQSHEASNKAGATFSLAPEKRLGSVYGPMNLVISDEAGPVIFGGEGTPLLGLLVSVDGEMTEYKTPLVAPGIPLAPGAHALTFSSREGEAYGPYWVEIEAGQALEKDFSVMKTPQHLLLLEGQQLNHSTSMPTTQPTAKTGTLIVNTYPLINLELIVDGKKTGKKTPVGAPGVSLSEGKHKVSFLASAGETYGSFTVEIIANEITRQRYRISSLSTEAPTSAPASAPSAMGFLIVNTFPFIDLEVVIDGKATGENTPVGAPGLSLSAGKHTLEFLQVNTGQKFGPSVVEIKAGETTRSRVTVK